MSAHRHRVSGFLEEYLAAAAPVPVVDLDLDDDGPGPAVCGGVVALDLDAGASAGPTAAARATSYRMHSRKPSRNVENIVDNLRAVVECAQTLLHDCSAKHRKEWTGKISKLSAAAGVVSESSTSQNTD